MRSSSLFSFLAFFLALAAAWPWHDAADNAPAKGDVKLRVRQDDSSRSSSAGDRSTITDSSSSPSSTSSSDSSDSSQSGSASVTASKSTGRQGTKTTKGPSHSVYDPRLPAGGVSMITPNALSSSQYYKIGDWVTFAWNYTSVSSMPTAVDILASCSANQATYTIGTNVTVDHTQKILWDTGEYQQTGTVPLLTETYTLIIYDAASSISATPESGYLAVADNFYFGMYSPQAYTPLASGWKCATCSGAMTSMERQTLSFLLGTSAITVLTFTYLTNSFGVL